jgi:transposase-like protein
MQPNVDLPKKTRSQKKLSMRIVCPHCGNDTDFFEVADGVILTTRYLQNPDLSFSQRGDESQILGEIRFFCGECNSDLSHFHQRFLDMLF